MSEFDQHPGIENAQNLSPEDLASQLFSKQPANPGSICILPYCETQDTDAASFNFEILLTIYLEGFMNILDVQKQTHLESNPQDSSLPSYEIENKIYKNITTDDLKFPEPWFQSFGYTINITEYGPTQYREFNNKIKPSSYCRTLLSFDPKDRIQFLMKDIKNRYTFILNGSYNPTNNVEKIYTILSKDDKFYKISFAPSNILTNQQNGIR